MCILFFLPDYMFCILTSITYFTIRFFCYTDLCEMLDIFQECGNYYQKHISLFVCVKSRKSPRSGRLRKRCALKDLYDQDKDGKLNQDEQPPLVAPTAMARHERSQSVCHSSTDVVFTSLTRCSKFCIFFFLDVEQAIHLIQGNGPRWWWKTLGSGDFTKPRHFHEQWSDWLRQTASCATWWTVIVGTFHK